MSERFQKIFFPASIFLIGLVFFLQPLAGTRAWISEVYMVETFSQYLPYKNFIADCFRQSCFPLWTHNCECGFPLGAHPQAASFYPLNLLYLFFDYIRASNFYSFPHALVLSYAAYGCGRELKFNRFGSWILALTSGLAGFHLFSAGCISFYTDICLIPLAYLLSLRLAHRPIFFNFLALVLGTALQFLAGEPEMVIYQTVFILAYLLFVERTPAKNMLLLALALGTAWLGCMVQALPAADLVFHSYRRLAGAAVGRSYPEFLADFAGLLAPLRFPFREQLMPSPVYLGFFFLVGVYLSCKYKETRRGLLAMAVVGMVCLIFMINPWPLKNLGAIGFVAVDARYKLTPPFQFWMLIAACAGISRFFQADLDRAQIHAVRNFVLAFVVFTALLIAAGLVVHKMRPGTGSFPILLLTPYRLIFIGMGILVVLVLSRERFKPSVMAALALLFLSDLLPVAWAERPYKPPADFENQSTSADFFYRLDPTGRVKYGLLYSTLIPTTLLTPFEATLIKYYNLVKGPEYLYSFQRLGLKWTRPLLLESADGQSNLGIGNLNQKTKPLLDLLGVKYILAVAPTFWGINPCPLDPDGQGRAIPFQLAPGREKRFQANFFPADRIAFAATLPPGDTEAFPLKVYLSLAGAKTEIILEPTPAASVWEGRLEVPAPTAGEIVFKNPAGENYRPLKIADARLIGKGRPFSLIHRDGVSIYQNSGAWPKYFLTADENDPPDPGRPLPRLLEFGSQEVKLRVHTDAPARLAVMESYYPGWRAFVNGQEQKISLAHRAFQSVPVPAAESQVRLVYQPRDFKIGLWFSLASFLSFIIFTAIFLIKPGNKAWS